MSDGPVSKRKAGMKVLPSLRGVQAEAAPARGQTVAMIEIDRVSQVFQTSGRQNHLALSEISLTIDDGAFVSILGPSGCGKSTLLYIVGGFVNPTEGVARMKGKAIAGPGPDRGPVFQEFALFPWKSVLGNVMYGPRQQGVKRAEAEAQASRRGIWATAPRTAGPGYTRRSKASRPPTSRTKTPASKRRKTRTKKP